MRKIMSLLLLMLLCTSSYAICDHINIQDISPDGTTITSNSGKVWVTRGDAAVGWDINDEVVMCNGDNIMINHDQNERVFVSRIH